MAIIKNPQELIDFVSTELKQEGFAEEKYDLNKVMEIKAKMNPLEMKANEVVHTGNTGYGAELVPGAIQTTDFLDLIPRMSPFIGALRGFHGRNLPLIAEVPVIGEIPYHQLMGETTTNLMTFANGVAKLPTAKIELRQKKFFIDIDVSDEEVRFVNVVDVVATIQRKAALSAAKTQEASLINGDTTAAATGNVNSDDGAPTSTSYYLAWNTLRKAGLANGVDIGALTFDDFLAVFNKLGLNYSNPADIMLLFNPQTYTKALGLSEFKEASINGRGSTIVTGAITNILGSDVFTSGNFRLTEADGKLSVNTASNTKGGLLAIHKDAIQYGYNGDYQMEIVRNPGKGWKIVGFYYMGANATANATVTDAELQERLQTMVVNGFNVTI